MSKRHLSLLETRELEYLRDSPHPLWSSVQPEKADAWLLFYIKNGLVEWVGNGYIITTKGRALLEQSP